MMEDLHLRLVSLKQILKLRGSLLKQDASRQALEGFSFDAVWEADSP